MELKQALTLCLIWLCYFLNSALAGENCTTGENYIEYCEHGCCWGDKDGNSKNGYQKPDYANCCIDPVLLGIILGSVFGGLAVIGLVIVIIICCVMKKKGKVGCGGQSSKSNGTVIQTNPPPTSTTSTTNNYATTYGLNQYSTGTQPYTTGTQPYPTGTQPYPTSCNPSQQNPPGPPPDAGIYNNPVFPPSGAPPAYADTAGTAYPTK